MYCRGSHFFIQPVSPARMHEASSHCLTQHGAPQCDKTGLLTLAGVTKQEFQREEEIEKPDQRLRGEPYSFHPAHCQVSLSLKLVARDERKRRDRLGADEISERGPKSQFIGDAGALRPPGQPGRRTRTLRR